jgi:Domain of unknown function (DUF4340)
MSARAMWIHMVFSALALLFAWRMANREEKETGGPTSFVLLDAAEGAVQKVEYRWPKGRSTAVRAPNDAPPIVEIDRELDDKKKDDKKKKDAKTKDAADAGVADVADAGPAEAEAPPKREQARFPGGKSVETALKGLEPLRSKRTLGEVDAEREKAMGLSAPERTLEVTTKKGAFVLEIGEAAYGGQGRYARVKGERIVHLVDTALVSGLEGGADSLMEKRVLPFDPEDIVSYEVRAGDKGGAFVHVDRAQARTRRFAPKEDPSGTREEAQKLINTVRSLRVQKLADPAVAGSPLVTFKVETAERGVVVVELLERTDGAGHLARFGEWVGEVSETSQKELTEDVSALLGD